MVTLNHGSNYRGYWGSTVPPDQDPDTDNNSFRRSENSSVVVKKENDNTSQLVGKMLVEVL